MTSTGRGMLGAALLSLASLALTGCTLLPDSGPVRTTGVEQGSTPSEPPYVAPPGPRRGASRAAIVKGFLAAMQASPISTATARSYLTERAQQSWRPGDGTVIYDAAAIDRDGDEVRVRLSDTHRLDASGSWLRRPTHGSSYSFRLRREKAGWRIDNPVNALMVRSVYFQDQFLLYDLYFFDRSGRVLVPDPVYVPRGEQTATSLVRGLLAGPDNTLASVVRSALPAASALDPAVVVTDSGVAEVPLGPEVLRLSPDELNRAMVQLAWTLRPVAGIKRVRITVDGTPVRLPDGRTDLGVDDGEEFAPAGLGATRELLGLRQGRVVTVSGGDVQSVAGGLGRRGFALRSIALDRSGETIAAVSADGRIAYTAGTEPGSRRVTRAFDDGHDLLAPSYDLFGNLWLVDRTARGAEVHVVRNGRERRVRFPGIDGERLTSFAVSPDGSRLVVGLADSLRPRALLATIGRSAGGRVQRGMRAHPLPVAGYDPAHELGPVVDVGWRTPTLVAVLTRPTRLSSRVVFAMADGSPGDGRPPLPDPYAGRAVSLVVNTDSGLPLMLLDERGRLARLDGAGKWEQTAAPKLSAAAYTN